MVMMMMVVERVKVRKREEMRVSGLNEREDNNTFTTGSKNGFQLIQVLDDGNCSLFLSLSFSLILCLYLSRGSLFVPFQFVSPIGNL